MPELGEQKPADVYNDLFHLNNENIGIDSTLRSIQSGNGEDTKIKVSTSQVEIDFNGGKSIKPEIKSSRYTYYENTCPGGSTFNINLNNGNIQKIILQGDLTQLTLSGAPTAGIAGWVRLIIERDLYSISDWPIGSLWPYGTSLDMTLYAFYTTFIVEFMTIDAGASWYAYKIAESII